MEAVKLFLLKAVTTPWVYTLLIIAAVAVILRLCYVSVKTKYIGYCGYGRAFSCDGAFAGDEFQLVETVTNPTFIPLFFGNSCLFRRIVRSVQNIFHKPLVT